MPTHAEGDGRVVMTLDAGGTNFVFSAIAGGRSVVEGFALPSFAGDLNRSLAAILEGFRRVRNALACAPGAVSFAFPGPADYRARIILAPPNLPAYRQVALGPMLEDKLGLPVFINNDGDLFAYGEATAGFLPDINRLLDARGSPKRFRNLLGLTLGTGFGGGIVHDGELYIGDNSLGGEIWLLRHKLERGRNVEEGASVRTVRCQYAAQAGIEPDAAPEPREIFAIAEQECTPASAAAKRAFRCLGEVVGDAIAQVITLLDGLVVIGGGIAGASRHFLPAIVEEMNSTYAQFSGAPIRRLVQRAFNLEDAAQLEAFLQGNQKQIPVPRTSRCVSFDEMPRVGVGISRLGTSEAVALGAYHFGLRRLAE